VECVFFVFPVPVLLPMGMIGTAAGAGGVVKVALALALDVNVNILLVGPEVGRRSGGSGVEEIGPIVWEKPALLFSSGSSRFASALVTHLLQHTINDQQPMTTTKMQWKNIMNSLKVKHWDLNFKDLTNVVSNDLQGET
jgi:hypothetical protein